MRRVVALCLILASLVLGACSKEARTFGPTVPQTPPDGPGDPRIADYRDNLYDVGQGSTYFGTYGCTRCHDPATPDLRRAKLPVGRGLERIYRAIADGHGALAFGRRVPAEQLWQLSAYLADLPKHTPDKRHRLAVDQQGEPVGSSWSGPLR